MSLRDASTAALQPIDENSTKKKKYNKKSEDPRLIAAKEVYDKQLRKLLVRKNFIGVEECENKLKHNEARGYKNIAGVGKISIKIVGGRQLLVTEAACVNDLSNRIIFMFKWLPSLEAKIAKMKSLLADTPVFVSFEDTSIVPIMVDYARSSRENDAPYNFMNPSKVNATWKKEVTKRGLVDVGEEFTYERKKATFDEVVRNILVKLQQKAKSN